MISKHFLLSNEGNKREAGDPIILIQASVRTVATINVGWLLFK